MIISMPRDPHNADDAKREHQTDLSHANYIMGFADS